MKPASKEEFEQAYAALGPPPTEQGVVARIVIRPAKGERAVVQTGRISPEAGLAGDRWAAGSKSPKRQVAIMMEPVAQLVASTGAPPELAGDNLYVTLDLSHDNLPVGTQLEIGGAILEITATAHNACRKFSVHFGDEAVKWINSKSGKQRRLRGVMTRVVRAGTIATGAPVIVVRR